MKQDNTVEIMEMMFKISRLMKQEMSYTNNLMHLSMMQIQTLIFIHKNENTSMSHIAEYFRIELPSATSLVSKLCEQKLIHRVDDPADRRLVRITLTGEGKTLLERAQRERKKKIEKLLSYLSFHEKSELLTILHALNNKLQT